jgi:DNA phosphorothioation-dependent restriction protein DptG
MSDLVPHFTKHTSEGVRKVLAKKLDIKVASGLEQAKLTKKVTAELEQMSLDGGENNAQNIQTAYDYLTKTCVDLSESSSKILTPYLEQLRNLSEEDIKARVDRKDPLKALEQMARVQKLISEHVQTMAAMRAPKVVVAQFLDLAINDIIRQTGFIFAEVCKTVEVEVCAELTALKVKGVGSQTFRRAFNKAVDEFKSSMMAMKRDQLARVIQALSEIEKIV